jgi:multidrug resistance protein, MATE family
MNFDYLLVYLVILSLATCVSSRVSNELGAGNLKAARMSAFFSIICAALSDIIGAVAMVMTRDSWGYIFIHDLEIIQAVNKILLIMALLEVVNFPLTAVETL